MTVPPAGPPIRLSALDRSVSGALRVPVTSDSQPRSRPAVGGLGRVARMTPANAAAMASSTRPASSSGMRRPAAAWLGSCPVTLPPAVLLFVADYPDGASPFARYV